MPKYAERIWAMDGSATIIKNLFHAMGDPSVISFGGGSPAAEALPIDAIREIMTDIIARDKLGIQALQYGKPQGELELRKVVSQHLMAPKGVEVSPEEVLITAGGLETMNMVCQLYINPGDVILVESPTFVHCVEIFEMFQAKCIACACDDQGFVLSDVEAKIAAYQPKMVYIVPTFQNPTGRTFPLDRRKALAELGSKHDVIILEDDPYRDIRYSGEELAPIKVFDKTGHTILANSFSKIFSPGSRLGYAVATPEIIDKLVNIKTATNSHTNTLAQVICAEFFNRGYYPAHHKYICDLYRSRRDVMLECMKEHMPAGSKYHCPDGGLFFWVELPEGFDAAKWLPISNQECKVAYLAGEGFFVEGNGKGRNCMRVSFSAVKEENIREGMARLGGLLERAMAELT